MKREFLMLASKYDAAKHNCAGMYVSEKLDGVRCFWDGGVSRGLLATEVPWANVEKHGRYVNPVYATGLWTRYGQPIQAPATFLDRLPPIPLDGELHAGRQGFQDVVSTVKSLVPGLGWSRIKYSVFDVPCLATVFADGRMTNSNFRHTFKGIASWLSTREFQYPPERPFYSVQATLIRLLGKDQYGPVVNWHPQECLSIYIAAAKYRLDRLMDEVVGLGGEGLMLRTSGSVWEPCRSKQLLKVKGINDAEGVVIGYVAGKSGVGTKLVELMGSLIVRGPNGVTFNLSGFTDSEREMAWVTADSGSVREYVAAREGQVLNSTVVFNPAFPIGTTVTYRYRELTRDGAPKEAKYHRVREQL